MKVTVHTDHQPLETIFKRPLHCAPKRLQRMMMRLQRYRINVVYKKGTTLYLADTLSRATLPTTNDCKQTNFEVFRLNLENEDTDTDGITSLTLLQLRVNTLKDPILNDLANVIISGWPPSKGGMPATLTPYWTFRDELTVQNGLLYKGAQVIVPASMCSSMLQKIHGAHLGPESNYRMCKDILFWPGMKSEIHEMCTSCGRCAQFKAQNQKEPMSSQPVPDYPWQFISQDLCFFEGINYLITVDHYSDFIEVDEVTDTLASTISAKTEAHIARHGAPEVALIDNGPQFIAS